MNLPEIVLTIITAFLSMEIVGWFTHKYIMHGFLWVLHLDHHTPEKTGIEKNDLFAIIFAAPSIILFILGAQAGIDIKFWIAVGIALYGTIYFFAHDVLIHKRLNLFGKPKTWYFKSVVNAHMDHHYGKKNYGFLFMIPWKYFKR